MRSGAESVRCRAPVPSHAAPPPTSPVVEPDPQPARLHRRQRDPKRELTPDVDIAASLRLPAVVQVSSYLIEFKL